MEWDLRRHYSRQLDFKEKLHNKISNSKPRGERRALCAPLENETAEEMNTT